MKARLEESLQLQKSTAEKKGHSDRSLARRTDRGATVGERIGGAELDGLVCLPRGGENCRGRREEGTKEAVTRREETEKPRAFRFVSDIHVGLGGGAVVL